MPYFSLEQIERSLTYLVEKGHPTLVSLLSMLRTDVPKSVDGSDAIRYGAPQENKLLKEFFSPDLASEEKPFYIPFGADGGKSRWRDTSYAGSGLQRQRKDRTAIFAQPNGENDRWYLRPGYVAAISASEAAIGKEPISLPALATWMFRTTEVSSLDEAVVKLVADMKIDRDGLIDPAGAFTYDDTAQVRSLALTDQPVDPKSLIELLNRYSPLPRASIVVETEQGSIGEVTQQIPPPGLWEVDEAALDDFGGLKGVREPVMRALAALRSGMHVIFTGPPGTGKTTLAEAICQTAGFPFWTIPATDQWTTFETIGGYFPVPSEDSHEDRLDFLPGAVVAAIEKQKCLIIDEINRADIDKAFGELFTLLTGKSVTLPYRRRSELGFRRVRLQAVPGMVEEDIDAIQVPEWWRLIGAMNDADKASLKRLSLAFVRRFAFVPIDLPDAQTYTQIIESALASVSKEIRPRVDELRQCVVELFTERGSGLGSIGLPLGPGIPLAMIRHGISEAQSWPSRTEKQIVRSAIDSYLVPQFQGRPDKHSEILNTLSPYVENIDDLEAVLGVWTGVIG